MKQWMFAGALAGSLALAGAAQAQQTPAQQPAAKPSTTAQTADKAAQPAKAKTTKTAKKSAEAVQGGERTPKQQPTTTDAANVTDTAMALGSVHIPKAVKADGKALPAGTYQVRLTANQAQPDAVGTSGKLERWIEFVQKGDVKGREVVSIVPQNEIKLVQKDTPPAAGGSKVEMLKGGDYMRVWINKGGNHYLIHLVP